MWSRLTRLLPSLMFLRRSLRGSPRTGNRLIGNLIPMRLMPLSRNVSGWILRTFMRLFVPLSSRLMRSRIRMFARLNR